MHRYSYVLTESDYEDIENGGVFAYGIGPTVYGHRYALLTGSGLNSSPPHFSGNLLGFLDRITNNGIVYGWACDSDAQDKSIKAHISLGTKEGWAIYLLK